jgi:hypothetical protein
VNELLSDETVEKIRKLIHDKFFRRGHPPTLRLIKNMLKEEMPEESESFKFYDKCVTKGGCNQN